MSYRIIILVWLMGLGGVLRAGAAQTLLVGSRDTDAVLEYDAHTGQFLRIPVAPGSGGLEFPTGILVVPEPGGLLLLVPAAALLRPGHATRRPHCSRAVAHTRKPPRTT